MVIKNGESANADEVIESIGRLSSQLAYEQVKSDSTNWTNTDYLGADIFDVAAGSKNTVDTTSSTALCDETEGFYMLKFTDEASGDTNSDPNTYTNASRAFDSDDATYAEKTGSTSDSLGKTFSSKFVGGVRIKASKDGASGNTPSQNTVSIILQTYDGSNWTSIKTWSQTNNNSGTLNVDTNYYLNDTVQGVRILFTWSSGSPFVSSSSKLYTLAYGDFDTSSTIETNTIINEVIPDSIVVYGKADLPASTSITLDLSDDGGATFALTGKSLNTAIDTTSFTTGNLAIKFNLATTDTSVTPKLYGYGVAITDA